MIDYAFVDGSRLEAHGGAEGHELRQLFACGGGAVSSVDCRFSRVETINMGAITNIRLLNVSWCAVSHLNLRRAASLQRLDISGTGIEFVDLRGCRELSTLKMVCSNVRFLPSLALGSLTIISVNRLVLPRARASRYLSWSDNCTLDNRLGCVQYVTDGSLDFYHRPELFETSEYLHAPQPSVEIHDAMCYAFDERNITHCQSINFTFCDIIDADFSCLGNLRSFTGEHFQMPVFRISGLPYLSKIICTGCVFAVVELESLPSLSLADFSPILETEERLQRASKITTLHLSGVGWLKQLYLSYSGLKHFSFDSLGNLDVLYIDYTDFFAMDVASFGRLRFLNMTESAINNLDVSCCPLLECVVCSSFHDVIASERTVVQKKPRNLWENEDYDSSEYLGRSSLILPGQRYFRYIQEDNLICCRFIDLSNSDIAHLNCRKLSNLISLSLCNTRVSELCVAQSRYLRELFVSNTGISVIDLRRNVHLQRLEMSGTRVSALDLSSCNKLKILFLDAASIRHLSVRGLGQLETLSASHTRLGYLRLRDCAGLCFLNVFSTGVTYLDCSGLPPAGQLRLVKNGPMRQKYQ